MRYARPILILISISVLSLAQQRMPHDNPQAALGEEFSELSTEAEVLASGKEQYMTVCAGCHGPMGEGGRGPSLADGRVVRRLNDRELISAIRNGVPGSDMPPFPFPEEQIWQIASYVRSLGAPAYEQPLPGDPQRGKELFYGAGGCNRCHMIRGEGGYLGPDLTNIGVTRQLSYLREALREPSKRFADGFRPVRVTLKSGEQVEGVAKNYTNYSAQVIDNEGNLYLLTRADLKSMELLKDSWMPGDLAKRFSDEQINDLLAFLSRQGLRPPVRSSRNEERE